METAASAVGRRQSRAALKELQSVVILSEAFVRAKRVQMRSRRIPITPMLPETSKRILSNTQGFLDLLKQPATSSSAKVTINDTLCRRQSLKTNE